MIEFNLSPPKEGVQYLVEVDLIQKRDPFYDEIIGISCQSNNYKTINIVGYWEISGWKLPLFPYEKEYDAKVIGWVELSKLQNVPRPFWSEDKLHVEISARQCGKSTRLIETVARHIEEGGHAVVFSPTIAMKHHLETLANEYNLGTLGRTPEFRAARDYDNWRIGLRGTRICDVRCFFDEFDFMKDHFPVLPNGYYTTTANYLRDGIEGTDKLSQLVKKVGIENVKTFTEIDTTKATEMLGMYLEGPWAITK